MDIPPIQSSPLALTEVQQAKAQQDSHLLYDRFNLVTAIKNCAEFSVTPSTVENTPTLNLSVGNEGEKSGSH